MNISAFFSRHSWLRAERGSKVLLMTILFLCYKFSLKQKKAMAAPRTKHPRRAFLQIRKDAHQDRSNAHAKCIWSWIETNTQSPESNELDAKTRDQELARAIFSDTQTICCNCGTTQYLCTDEEPETQDIAPFRCHSCAHKPCVDCVYLSNVVQQGSRDTYVTIPRSIEAMIRPVYNWLCCACGSACYARKTRASNDQEIDIIMFRGSQCYKCDHRACVGCACFASRYASSGLDPKSIRCVSEVKEVSRREKIMQVGSVKAHHNKASHKSVLELSGIIHVPTARRQLMRFATLRAKQIFRL